MPRAPRSLFRKKGPSLSLCMIVKNEAKTLDRCLDLARPYVDEIVVVDTGSTDGTQEIAQRYADVYDEIEWPGSFSKARNYSMELASGAYILILDGDEYIEDSVYWRRIRKALTPDVAAVQLAVLNLMKETALVASDRFWQARVMVNDPSIRYEGRVHNQVSPAIDAYAARTGTKTIRVEAEVVHVGYSYSSEGMKKKYQPRLELLKAEYEDPRSDVHRAYYGYQLGLVYKILERYDEAADVFNKLDYNQLTPQNAFYTHLLAAQTALKLDNLPMALVHGDQMLTLDRTEPTAYYLMGVAMLKAKEIHNGLLMLLEAFNINDDHQKTVRFALNPAQLLKVLATACRQVGLQSQGAAFQALAEKEDYDVQTVRALITSLQAGIAKAEMEEAA